MEICELLKIRNQCQFYESIERRNERFSELRKHIASHPYTATEVREVCRAEGFCPYELVKKALTDVDVVALSYMYVFDSTVRGAFLNHLDSP